MKLKNLHWTLKLLLMWITGIGTTIISLLLIMGITHIIGNYNILEIMKWFFALGIIPIFIGAVILVHILFPDNDNYPR